MFRSELVNKIITTDLKDNDFFLSEKGRTYTFLNPVSYLDALNNKDLFLSFDGIFADGSILVSAIAFLYGKKICRRSFDMTSLAPIVFKYAQDNSKTIYIVASKQNQVENAVNIIKAMYYGINIIGYRNGYFSSEKEQEEEVLHITEISPDFLIVGMGAIIQEKFLQKVKQKGFRGIGFTCGGFIHQIAKNEIDYYPKWVDRNNIRFLYRMYREPHTRKRYLKAGLGFPFKFLWERIWG